MNIEQAQQDAHTAGQISPGSPGGTTPSHGLPNGLGQVPPVQGLPNGLGQGPTTVPAPPAGDPSSSDGPFGDLGAANAEIQKLRQESAARRVALRAAEADASKWAEHQQAQLSDLEKAQSEIAQLREQLAQQERGDLARTAATAAGLDPGAAQYLQGSTAEELAASAAALKALLAGGTQAAAPNGQPGRPVPTTIPVPVTGPNNGTALPNMDEWMRQQR